MTWILITAIMGVLMATTGRPRCEEGEMISLLKRHEIQVLLKAGFSVGDVAARSATSADTVRRVRREEVSSPPTWGTDLAAVIGTRAAAKWAQWGRTDYAGLTSAQKMKSPG